MTALDVMKIEYKSLDKVLIIGSGIAGLMAAIEAKKHGVEPVIFTKGKAGRDGSSIMSEADLALDGKNAHEMFNLQGNSNDSPEQFYNDMIKGGMYLNNQKLVEKHVNLAPKYVKKLKNLGLNINTLIKTGGHKYPRGLWTSGEEVVNLLKKEVKRNNIQIVDNSLLIDLIKVENKIKGVLILSLNEGQITFYQTKAVILATGGASNLYSQNTNSPFTTGDGIAAAYRVNAELVDMEFPMFLPFTVLKPNLLKGMVFPYDLIINLNAYMLNKRGERYIRGWAPHQMENTTRDINSVAAEIEIKNGNGSPNGGLYMSFKHLPNNIINESANWLPDSIKNWKYGGLKYKDLIVDLTKDALEVKPGCHFWNGGIKIDLDSSTTVKGLYACGEGTGGIHGSNRISGNALTQALVWGGEAGKNSSKYFKNIKDNTYNDKKLKMRIDKIKTKIYSPILKDKGFSPIKLRDDLNNIADNYLRPVRSEQELEKALELCNKLEEKINNQVLDNKGMVFNKEWQLAIENHNLLLIMKTMIRSTKLRKESRGAHYREDYPNIDNKEWLKNIIIYKNKENKLDSKINNVVINDIKPPEKIIPYGEEINNG